MYLHSYVDTFQVSNLSEPLFWSYHIQVILDIGVKPQMSQSYTFFKMNTTMFKPHRVCKVRLKHTKQSSFTNSHTYIQNKYRSFGRRVDSRRGMKPEVTVSALYVILVPIGFLKVCLKETLNRHLVYSLIFTIFIPSKIKFQIGFMIISTQVLTS